MGLPGQKFVNGVSNYIFGTNHPNYDDTNPNIVSDPQIQGQLKTAGITVIRASLTHSSGTNYSDSDIDKLTTAVSGCGAALLAILPHAQTSYSQHAVTYLGSHCLMYEYSNERDINGMTWQEYLSEWNALIPTLRSINPRAAFIGPVLGAFSNVDNYLIPWLKGTVTAGTQPDAISVHIYPCTTDNTAIAQSVCSSRASGIGASVAGLRSKVQGVLGYSVPLCCTEWNADAYYNNSTTAPHQRGQGYNSNAPANDSFNNQFAIDALEGFVSNGIDMANHFEIDYFLANKSGPTSTTAQYRAFATEVQKYNISGGGGSGGGGTTSSTLTASPTSVSMSSVVNGSAQSQSTTLTNNGSAGNLSAPISYSDNASLNWCSVATSSTLGGGGTTGNAVITCTPVSGLPAGTHTATIAFTIGSQVANVSVTFTVTGGTNTAQHILAPAYEAPGGTNGQWTKYENAGTAVGYIIANPNSGPGTSQSTTFVNGIAAMHAKGIKVLGYVWTNAGSQAIATVESQIDQWYNWYNIDGIHLDDALCNSTNLSYYTSLYNYVKAKDSVRNYVFLNPASVPPENYMPILDTVLIYENNYGGSITTQPYMKNYAASKFGATILNVSTISQVDTVMSALKNANVGFVFLTDQSGASPYFAPPNDTVWNETLADLGTATSGTGGSSAGTTALSTYFAAVASTTLTTANQLYTILNSTGTPTSTWSYTRVATSTGFGEIVPQTETGAWEALSSIGAPSGEGFLYDSVVLENNQLNAGNWGATIRLNAAQNGDAADSAGTLVGDLYVRAFKRSSAGVYTPIVVMSLLNQTIPAGRTNFQLPNVATSTATPFGTGDKLYLDIWCNITSNTNNSSVQDIRLNRLSTDTSGLTGDALGFIATPGYSPTTTSSGNATITTSVTSLTFSAVQGGAITTSQNITLTNSGAASGSWTESINYAQGNGWLALSITSDTLAAGASEQVALSCNPQGLAVGTYNASVIFTMGTTTANVAVTFTVSSPSAAFLSVSPTSLNFSVTR